MGKEIGILIAVVVLGGVFIIGAWGYKNTFVANEATIKAGYQDNQNIYDNFWKMAKEIAQVPEVRKDDLKEVWDGVMGGRYGDGGAKAVWQWIQEQNPDISPELYTKIQTAVEAGRNKFAANQTSLLEKKRTYEAIYKGFPGMVYAGLMNYPRINLDEYKIVTSVQTDEAFKTGKAEEIDIFGKKER